MSLSAVPWLREHRFLVIFRKTAKEPPAEAFEPDRFACQSTRCGERRLISFVYVVSFLLENLALQRVLRLLLGGSSVKRLGDVGVPGGGAGLGLPDAGGAGVRPLHRLVVQGRRRRLGGGPAGARLAKGIFSLHFI